MYDNVSAACSSAQTTVVVGPHLRDGRITDLGLRRIVPLRVLGGSVGVEEPLMGVAEDPFLRVFFRSFVVGGVE